MRSVAYRIPLPLARAQGTSNADRPVCALVSAYASLLRGEQPLGILKDMSIDAAKSMVMQDGFQTEYLLPPSRVTAWAESINGAKIGDRNVPPVLGGQILEPYQIDAVARMSPCGGVLALGCGLGKTLAACAYAHAISARKVLVLAPLNALGVWEKHRKLLPDPSQLTVHSMDSAHHLLGVQSWDLIIFDEAHLQGHSKTKRTKNAHTLRLRAHAGLCLTGTLLHSGVIKTLSVLDLAIPGAAQFGNRWGAGEFFHCLVRKQLGGRTVTELGSIPSAYRDAFHRYLSRHVVALTPQSDAVRAVLQLPGQSVYDLDIGKPWPSIESAAAAYVHARIADAAVLPSAAETAHALCAAGAAEKAEWVLNNLGDDPAVLFAHYTETLNIMEAGLKAAGITYVRVDGDVLGPARVAAQQQFQSGLVQVFLGQMQASGISMDLFRTAYSIALDHTWRPDVYAQALARTHRRGQVHACHHWDLVANQLQARVVARLRAGEEFNSAAAEWQQVKAGKDLVESSCVVTQPV